MRQDIKKKDFLYVYEQGQRYSGTYSLIFLKTKEEKTKFGITVTKQVGKAVARSKIKRWYREIFRLNKHQIKPGTMIIAKAKPNIINAAYQEVQKDFLDVLKKANVFDYEDA